MDKYKFKIKTRNQVVVEKVAISAEDFKDAQKRLEKMYHQCEIVSYEVESAPPPRLGFDEILDVITQENAQ